MADRAHQQVDRLRVHQRARRAVPEPGRTGRVSGRQDICSCTYLLVDAENWGVAGGVVTAELVDELELLVAFGGRAGRDALVVHAQGVAQAAQEAGNGARGNRQLEDIGEVVSEVAGGAPGPAQVGTGVASGVVTEQMDELDGQCRLFLASALRPPRACGCAPSRSLRTATAGGPWPRWPGPCRVGRRPGCRHRVRGAAIPARHTADAGARRAR